MSVLVVGEALVEFMRSRRDVPLDRSAEIVGPFPSGAPAIFADYLPRPGASAAPPPRARPGPPRPPAPHALRLLPLRRLAHVRLPRPARGGGSADRRRSRR